VLLFFTIWLEKAIPKKQEANHVVEMNKNEAPDVNCVAFMARGVVFDAKGKDAPPITIEARNVDARVK
jgi:hypothetical protein